jgi:hypothetical protein
MKFVNTKTVCIHKFYLMKEFFAEIWGTVKAVIIGSISLSVAGIAILLFGGGVLLATLYWPFYSYDYLNSFVSETQKIYPFEVRFGSDSSKKSEMDNYFLMAGKMYCGAKLVNQHVALKSFVSQSTKAPEDQKQLDTLYENADKYLCPTAAQIASSK